MSGPIILGLIALAVWLLTKYLRSTRVPSTVARATMSGTAPAASAGTASAATAAPAGAAGGTPPKKSVREWVTEYLWTILLAGASAAVFYWYIYTPGLRLSEVGEWSWNHWLSLPAFCGLVLALIKLNEDVLGKLAGMLQTGMVLTMFMLFFVIPGWFGLRDASLFSPICENGSVYGPTSCKLNTAWSTMFRAAEGKAADGTTLCYDNASLVEYEVIVKNGTTFNRFRSKEGKVEVRYQFMKLPPGGKCPEL